MKTLFLVSISSAFIFLHLMTATSQQLQVANGIRRGDTGNTPSSAFSGVSRSDAAHKVAVTSSCKPEEQAKSPAHIVVVVEENHGYPQIMGNPEAAYINSLAAAGMLFTNYHAISHPSQPNYFALFSGSTQGIDGDGEHFFPSTPSIAGELERAGYSFVGYTELPAERDHTPWVSFADAQRAGQPFSRFPTDYSTLPTVSFVIPNLRNDMHDGSIAEGDQWLKANLGAYADWAMTHDSLLVLTFDEDQGTTSNHVATIIVGTGVEAGRSMQRVDHYALLHTIELLYGLPPLGVSGTSPVLHFGWQGCAQ